MPVVPEDFAPPSLPRLPASLEPAGSGAVERALGALAEVLAHRLRGPLAAIQAYTDLLTDTLATTDQRQMALRIFEAAAALEATLADLQRYGLALEPVPRAVSLWACVADVCASLGQPPALADTLEPDLEVWADPVLLQQALLALVQNALDAGAAPSLAARVIDGHVHLAVRSEAPIAPEAAARAFEPFFTTKAQNLGLGLPLARRIARALGGDLVLATPPGPAAVFVLSVPLRNGGGTNPGA